MSLEKAIAILTIDNDHNPDITDADRSKAHQLGIEALKSLNEDRFDRFGEKRPLLLGETEE